MPPYLIAGATAHVKVHSEIPDAMGTVTLHVEMKTADGQVRHAETAPVRGTGTHTFAFTVSNLEISDRVHFAVWYGRHWQQAMIPIHRTAWVPVVTAAEAARWEQLRRVQQAAAKAWRKRNAEALARGPVTAVLDDALPGLDRALAARLLAALATDGYRTLRLSAADVGNPAILAGGDVGVLVLPTASVFPSYGGPAVQAFLEGGGALVAPGTPAFEQAVSRVGQTWMT